MFIATYQNNKIVKENDCLWDDVPDGLINLQLTSPIKVNLKNPDGSLGREIAPLITLGKYDRYYFWNEATATATVQGDKIKDIGEGRLVAKVIAGIDDERKIVVEVRVDLYSNVKISHYPLEDLKEKIKRGQFRKEIIKKGI